MPSPDIGAGRLPLRHDCLDLIQVRFGQHHLVTIGRLLPGIPALGAYQRQDVAVLGPAPTPEQLGGRTPFWRPVLRSSSPNPRSLEFSAWKRGAMRRKHRREIIYALDLPGEEAAP